jgi:hypothetical protein
MNTRQPAAIEATSTIVGAKADTGSPLPLPFATRILLPRDAIDGVVSIVVTNTT